MLVYEAGYAAEAGWQQPGFPPFDYVRELLDNRIANICAITQATHPPILYLTGKSNFRYGIAKRTPYKERVGYKPWHYKNIKAYMNAAYDVRLQEGLEADDLMSIEQTRRESLLNGNPFYSGPTVRSIICTRDKDLRAVRGWHYGWELGNQPSFGPEFVEETGYIKLSSDRKSIKGTGLLFFYSQCLTGDKVDSIPGLEGCGAVKAFSILEGCVDTNDAFNRVLEAYRAVYEDAEEQLLEQGQLLWMTRELHPDGSPVLWRFPDKQETIQ